MRVAVISDVHANRLALDAVLADIERHNVEKILNLGDHLAGPLRPKETARRLLDIDMIAIRGNTDRYLIEANPAFLDDEDRAIIDQAGDKAMEWLRALPATDSYGGAIFMSHGSPRSDETYWLDRSDGAGGFRVASATEIEREFPETKARLPVYCCGHTHIARVMTLSDGTIVFNPGSVGRPSFNMNDAESASRVSPAAAYAIVEQSAGKWHVNLRQIPYDNMAAAAMAQSWGNGKWARDLERGRLR